MDTRISKNGTSGFELAGKLEEDVGKTVDVCFYSSDKSFIPLISLKYQFRNIGNNGGCDYWFLKEDSKEKLEGFYLCKDRKDEGDYGYYDFDRNSYMIRLWTGKHLSKEERFNRISKLVNNGHTSMEIFSSPSWYKVNLEGELFTKEFADNLRDFKSSPSKS